MVIRVALAAVVVVVLLAAVLLASRPANPPPPVDRPVRVTNLPDPVPATPPAP
jgi:hypothetical protein